MKKLLTTLTLTVTLTLVLQIEVRSQQLPVFAQYNLNPVIINPAYAGTNNTLNLAAVYRKQWLGIDGAPETVTFSAHAPVSEYNIGVGLTFWTDKVGATRQTAIQSSYAYKIETGLGTLSFGLQMGLFQYSTDFAESNVGALDPTFTANDINAWKFNTGAGVFFYEDNYFAGFSAPLLLNSKYKGEGDVQYELKQHYFLTGGYIFMINDKLDLKPFTMLKVVRGSPMQVDFNVTAYYDERWSLGLQYRTKSTFAVILEFGITDDIYFGYSLDFLSGDDLGVSNDGSHEFVINYFVPWRGKKMKEYRKY